MKHSRVSRIVNILTTLQSGQKYTPADLEKLLGISRRTVFRDLKELQSIGIPYKYNKEEGSYRIDPKFFLPPIDFSLQEALSLLMLVHKLRHSLPSSYKNSALLAGMKIENNLPVNIRQYCHSSLANITIANEPRAVPKCLDNAYRTIQKAMRTKTMLEISYAALYEQQQITTTLHPYHLLYKRRAWYVIGYSTFHNAVRTFNIGRIQTILPLNKNFNGGENFNINDYVGKAWCLIPEGKIYDVKLWFSPMVAQNVSEVQWHSTQLAQWHDDGSLTLNFRVDGLNEISWWILGYGDQVKVLSPAALRQKVLERAENLLKNHNHPGQ